MLGRQHDRVDADRDAVLVTQRDLALGVRAQPWQRRLLRSADLRLLLDDAMRVIDRCRHQLLGLVAGVAEHQALVAGALFFRILAIDTHRDVRRLFADQIDRKSTRLNSSHYCASTIPSSASKKKTYHITNT